MLLAAQPAFAIRDAFFGVVIVVLTGVRPTG